MGWGGVGHILLLEMASEGHVTVGCSGSLLKVMAMKVSLFCLEKQQLPLTSIDRTHRYMGLQRKEPGFGLRGLG